MSGYLQGYTKYFSLGLDDETQYTDCKKLDSELRSWFIIQQDSKLQDRFANYLITLLIDKLGPLFSELAGMYQDLIDDRSLWYPKTESELLVWENGRFANSVADLVRRWIYIIRKNVKTFAPELYQQNNYVLDRLLPYYDEDGNETDYPTETSDPVPQAAQPGVRLQWKGDKTDFAELVWALSKSGRIADNSTGQPVTLTELARQFETMFEQPLDVDGLVSKRIKNTNKSTDGKTFIHTLLQLMQERIAKSEKR